MAVETRVNGNEATGPSFVVPYHTALYTESIDTTFFIAPFRCTVVSGRIAWRVAESGGTLTAILRRCQGTEAPASGDALSTAVSCLTTAETVQALALTSTVANLILEPGDRLAIDYTDDTAGELAGVYLTVELVRAP